MFLNNIFKNISPAPMIRPTPCWLRPFRSSRKAFTENSNDRDHSRPRGAGRSQHPARDHSALSGLKFGSVEITVHNGQVVQIERKEKFRLQPTGKHA